MNDIQSDKQATRMIISRFLLAILLTQVCSAHLFKGDKFSLNNRGPLPMNRREDRSSERFSTYQAASWSQPDPRKVYSTPVGPINSVLAANHLYNQRAKLNNLKRQTIGIGENLSHLAAYNNVDMSTLTGGDLPQQQVNVLNSKPVNNLAMIKYVPIPVLYYSIPTTTESTSGSNLMRQSARLVMPGGEQKSDFDVTSFLAGSSPSLASSSSSPSSLLDLIGPDIQQGTVEHNPLTSQYIFHPVDPQATSKLVYVTSPLTMSSQAALAPPMMGAQTNKAFSAYASKLMSMLRRSAILASMAPGQNPASHYLAGSAATNLPTFLISSATPVAPSTTTGQLVALSRIPNASSTDLLLNQASRLTTKQVIKPTWLAADQQQSSMCPTSVHGQKSNLLSAPESYTSTGLIEQSNDPSFDFPTGSSSSDLGSSKQQLVMHQQTSDIAPSSRSLPSSAEKVIKEQKLEWSSKKLKHSPPYIGQKQKKSPLDEDHYPSPSISTSSSSPSSPSSSSSSSSSSSLFGRQATSQEPLVSPVRNDGAANVNNTNSMIPFTYSDKLAATPTSTPASQMEQPSNAEKSNLVVFDEPPDETPISLQESGSRTSFMASSGSSHTGQHGSKLAASLSSINYKRENPSGNQFPIILASSSSRSSSSPTSSSSSTRGFEWSRPLDMAVAPSSVTTTSTVDGRLVMLASGFVAAPRPPKAPNNRSPGTVSFSSLATAAGNSSTSSRQQSNRPKADSVELMVDSQSTEGTKNSSSSSSSSSGSLRSSSSDNSNYTNSHDYNERQPTNQFSHDKSLQDDFSRISVQTNPLHLMELQNSRSDFQHRARSGSIAMFHNQMLVRSPTKFESSADKSQLWRATTMATPAS